MPLTSARSELNQFQRIVAETAKALWRAANPDRERLPAHFEERTRLCLRKIEEGSAVAPLEIFIQEEEPQLFEPEIPEVQEAIGLAKRVLRAAENDEPLPENLPRALLPEYERWGQGLREDEAIEIETPFDSESARVTLRSRLRLAAVAETPYEAYADLTGEVLEADVRQGRFQLWLDERSAVTAVFPPELEDQVTTALREHRTTRVRIRGRAEFSPQGKPVRVTRVATWEMLPIEGQPVDGSARPIEEVLGEPASEIPGEDWRRLPTDLTSNLDHYLYGSPKR